MIDDVLKEKMVVVTRKEEGQEARERPKRAKKKKFLPSAVLKSPDRFEAMIRYRWRWLISQLQV